MSQKWVLGPRNDLIVVVSELATPVVLIWTTTTTTSCFFVFVKDARGEMQIELGDGCRLLTCSARSTLTSAPRLHAAASAITACVCHEPAAHYDYDFCVTVALSTFYTILMIINELLPPKLYCLLSCGAQPLLWN